ncbi:MAG TPA: META domain-containing protein [Cellvibrio sp.]
MKTKVIGVLATIAFLNTACSKEENTPPSYTNASTANSTVTTIASSAASSTEVIESTLAEPGDATAPAASEFLNTYWKLTVLNDAEVTVSEKEREPYIVFNAEKRIAGSDGCNRIMGSYTLEGEKLTLSEIASTMMACAEGGAQADAFRIALEKVASFTIHADQLELRDNTGLVIARFKAVALTQ